MRAVATHILDFTTFGEPTLAKLLDKDVSLLRDQVVTLPLISLNADQDLIKRLEQARALVTADD